jgi:hypothetical protein
MVQHDVQEGYCNGMAGQPCPCLFFQLPPRKNPGKDKATP